MYQLGLLSQSPSQDIGRLLAFTACAAFFGMSFAIPLRRFYILRLKLVFPTPTATALTIRALHSGISGAVAARKKAMCLMYSFAGAILLRVVSQYAPGILWDWHPFWWLATWGAKVSKPFSFPFWEWIFILVDSSKRFELITGDSSGRIVSSSAVGFVLFFNFLTNYRLL